MKLADFIKNIENVNEELIIFLENLYDFNSDIILSDNNENHNMVKNVNGKKYHYLLEVFIAKEFINDWILSLNHKPSEDEIAKRLYDYAINDA